MGTQAKGGTVRSNWKIGSKALDIILFVPIKMPKPIPMIAASEYIALWQNLPKQTRLPRPVINGKNQYPGVLDNLYWAW